MAKTNIRVSNFLISLSACVILCTCCIFMGYVCFLNIDLFPSPNLSAMRAASFETRRLFEGTIFSSHPHVVESKISSEKVQCLKIVFGNGLFEPNKLISTF